MSRAIAYCTDAAVFNKNQILVEECAKKYPGSLWMPVLARFAKERGIEVVTGDVALSNIESQKWKASDVYVVQEENAIHGIRLMYLGARPLILFSLESPLYAGKFYASLAEKSSNFKNKILFKGVFNKAGSEGVNHVAFFPSYSQTVSREITPWSERKYLVMVAANKYWKIKRPFYRQLIAFMRDLILQRKSFITQDVIDRQLHDKRLEIIEYFGGQSSLDLYGTGWESIDNLPSNWEVRLKSIIRNLKPAPCSDKNEIISSYKFAACLENMSYPGYITEKIIDCFSVGVIPIYLGAPDICDFVPKASFIDLREFANLGELNRYLTKMTEAEATGMINVGREFLSSKSGAQYSYESFAGKVLRMLEEYEQ